MITHYFDIDPGELLHGGLLLPALRVLCVQPLVLLHLAAQEGGQDRERSRGHARRRTTTTGNHCNQNHDVDKKKPFVHKYNTVLYIQEVLTHFI